MGVRSLLSPQTCLLFWHGDGFLPRGTVAPEGGGCCDAEMSQALWSRVSDSLSSPSSSRAATPTWLRLCRV